METVYVIIVTYNSEGSIRECLESVRRQTIGSVRTVVIDAGSGDATLAAVRAYFSAHPDFGKRSSVIANPYNPGFAKSVNMGLARALSDRTCTAVFLLNPDAAAGPAVIAEGLKVLKEHPAVGACGPKIMYPDGTIWWAGTRLFTDRELIAGKRFGVAEHVYKGEKSASAPARLTDVDALTGCAMIIRTSGIRKTGFFDERYFMYMEDIDYCRRLKRAGYRVVYFPKAAVIHSTEDRKADIKAGNGAGLKKYRRYLTSAFLYLSGYKPLILPFWLLKLPVALAAEYVGRRSR